MRVTGLQLDIAWEAKERNRSRVEEILGGATTGDLLELPEMFSTGFTMNAAAAAEPEGVATEQWLFSLARKNDCAVRTPEVRRDTSRLI